MINLSMAEAVRLYGELVDAYYGKNSFGGDTAELYMYRFGAPVSPPAADYGLFFDLYRDKVRRACESLYNLLAFFAENYPRARVEVDGRPFGEWVRVAGFDHRVHVRVAAQRRAAKQVALVEYLVRVVPPGDEVRNEVMEDALRVAQASIGHSLERVVRDKYVRGVDALGRAGFDVRVEQVED